MSTRVSYFITCDICGESDGYSHTEDIARAEVRSHGWIRQRNERGELVDMCWRCVERQEAAEEWAKAPAIEFGPEVQP